MPKRAVMNRFERRALVKRLVAAGGWATGASVFDEINLAQGQTLRGDAGEEAGSTLDATAWQSYAIWGPWESGAL